MYFSPSFHRPYSFIARMRPLYRYVMTLLFLNALTCIWLFTCYFRVARTIERHVQEIDHIKNQYALCQESLIACEQLTPRIRSLARLLQKNQALSINETMQRSLSTVFDTLIKTDVMFKAYKIEQELDNEWYHQSIMRFDLAGTYPNIINYFEHLNKSDMLMKINSIAIHHGDKSLFSVNCVMSLIALK